MPAPGPSPTAASMARSAEHRACGRPCHALHDMRLQWIRIMMNQFLRVMAGLVAAINVLLAEAGKTWMPATSAGMTVKGAYASDHQSDRMLDKMPEGGKQFGAEDTVDHAVIARQRHCH